jgi:hypothetical protein
VDYVSSHAGYLGGLALIGFRFWVKSKIRSILTGNKGEIEMLEGKELEGNIGSIGHYQADLDDKGNLDVMVGIKIDLIAECEKLAAKTGTKLDDSFVAVLKKLTGRG